MMADNHEYFTGHAERIAALEQRLDQVEKQGDNNTVMLMEIRDILMQAKGAKWLLVGMVGIGGFLAGLSPKIFALFGK